MIIPEREKWGLFLLFLGLLLAGYMHWRFSL
ncbi:hypothetical protein AFULGI_00003820 [Archaeoglobus fulgidus DSM 8774]|uniref:Uncharacterized protein n=2 Tax=Archaeoglobus fulgidus TaxID=2234 RepID=A0A075WB22_ARCFL|nr:hypothetical protein AFULGI_00003820 [Archaeoglobus fulgidus DSM 8774]KUK05308.1 MAG: hypothetical protein XD48_2456 [Archaeoglobus fulgidus]